MTDYIFRDNKINALSGDYFERNVYFEQARKAYEQDPDNMTFLPVSPQTQNIGILGFDLTGETFSSSQQQLEADKYIIQKTLETTFEQGDMDFNSWLIVQTGRYGGEQEPRNAAAYQEIVGRSIRSQLVKDPDWVNRLNAAAKLTYIEILSEKKAREAISQIDFELPTDKTEVYSAGRIAESILQKDLKRQEQSYNRSEKSLYSWNMQAKLLQTVLNGNLDIAGAEKIFMNLLNAAETDYRSDSSRADRVNTLAELMAEMGRQKYNLKLPAGWADKVPACEEAQKLFYNAMYYNGMSDLNLSRGSLNDDALNRAQKETAAQKLLDQMNKKTGISLPPSDMDLLAQYRPDELLAYKNFAVPSKMQLLKHPHLKVPDSKRLSLMTQIINETKEVGSWKDTALKDEDVNYFLESALRMKNVSAEMNKFIETIRPIVGQKAEQYNEDAAYVKEADAALKNKLQSEKDYDDVKAASEAYIPLREAAQAIKSNVSEKEGYLQPEKLEEIIQNALAGREPNVLTIEKTGKLVSLFIGKDEKRRQADLEQAAAKFNCALSALPRHKNVFDQMKAPMTSESYIDELNQKMRTTHGSREAARENCQGFWELDFRRNRAFDYEKNNPGKMLENLIQQVETRRTTLKTKAKENLSYTFKGQDFSGEPVLAEHERKTKKIYKAKAEQLRRKIRESAKEEMANRGVFEKPDLEQPDQTGVPMSKESSSKVTKMMKDKKIYEKLSRS